MPLKLLLRRVDALCRFTNFFLKSAAFSKKKLGFISCFECALAKNDFERTKYRIIMMDGWG